MIQTTVQIDGMQCSMCEAHVNEAIRKAFSVEKVSSSHSKKQTIIISEANLDEQQLKNVIEGMGYIFVSATQKPYEKKKLLSFLKK